MLRLANYAADTGNGGGTEATTGDGVQADSQTQTVTTPTGGGQQTGTTAPTFTQADIDRIAGKTRKEALALFAKEHGFTDVKALEEIVKAKREADEQAKTELQKALELANTEKQAREALESQLKQERIRAAVVKKATELNFAYPDDTLALLDMSSFELDDKGKVTGFEKALEDLAKSGRLQMKVQRQQIGNQTRTSGTTGAQPKQEGPQRPIIRF